MFRYFGRLVPGTSVREGEWTVEFRCTKEGNCIYSRYMEGDKVKVEEVLSGVDELYLYPDIYGGENVFYIYLKFNKEIVLAPDSQAYIMVGVPIAIKVVMSKTIIVKDLEKDREWVEEKRYTIDHIPFSEIVYALYGRPERGILARYYKVKVGSWLLLKEAPLELLLINNTQDVKKVSKIVFPVFLPKLFYVPGDGKVDVSPLQVELERGVAVVRRLTDSPRKKGYVEVPETGKISKWVAIFGL